MTRGRRSWLSLQRSGRPSGYPPGPPQIRTCAIRASGSSTSRIHHRIRNSSRNPYANASADTCFPIDDMLTRVSRHRVLDRFPAYDTHSPASPSLHRVPSDSRFPDFTTTMTCSDSRCPIPADFYWSQAGTTSVVAHSLRSGIDHYARRPGEFGFGFSDCRFSGGEHRASQVPGEPPCQHALLFDPGGMVRMSGNCDMSMLPSVVIKTSAPANRKFRGSITRPIDSLSTLRPVRRRTRRKTRFRLVASLCRVGFAPTGFHRPISAALAASLAPKLAWRTMTLSFTTLCRF